MSYIKQKFSMQPHNSRIADFLVKEGFKEDSWHSEKCLQFVHGNGSYTVWVMVYSNRIGYYVEYDCGGEVASGDKEFESSDFDDFLDVYKQTIDYLVYWLE